MRPYVICHMVTSLDGKVTGEYLRHPATLVATDVYYEINRAQAADAFACGRVTMEGSFTEGYYPDLTPFAGVAVPRLDCVADPHARFFAVAFDRLGRLGWQGSVIEDEDPGYGGAHIVEVLTEAAPDAYLAYLNSIGVSYVFAGENELDLALALEKLSALFGIKRLLLEGGSVLDGAFQRADLVDELSLVVAPVLGGADDKPLFENSRVSDYTLLAAKEQKGGVLWLTYRRNQI